VCGRYPYVQSSEAFVIFPEIDDFTFEECDAKYMTSKKGNSGFTVGYVKK